jgi:myo-inositol 2-dehydrogenase / D-chiro-inositol 1-dehydrogenase
MRIAQIGVGRIGQLHAQVLASHPLVDTLVVADLDEARAKDVANAIGARPTTVHDAIAAADAIVIATATSAHAQLIRLGIAARLPIFCEKPLALDLHDSARLVDEIESAGIQFQLGFQRRFDPAYQRARRLVTSGELGRLYQVRMTANDHTPPPEEYIPTSGGFFRDSSIHDFDAVRYVADDEVDTIQVEGGALSSDVFARYGDVDTVVATMRLRSGALAVLTGGRHNPRGYDIRMELVGSNDAVVMGLGPHTPLRPLDDDRLEMQSGWDSFLDRFGPAYRAELAAFVELAAGRTESACTARDGLEAMRIAEAASRSLVEGRKVALEEVKPGGKKEVTSELISH